MISIGVIIPVYNAESYLDKCIESVLGQTYRNLQLILVNDGSTDSSAKICDKYSKIDNRVKVVHKKNGGAASARNEGIKHCNAEYITFIDSDDLWENNYAMEKVVDKIKNNPKAEVIIHDIIKFYENDNKIVRDKVLYDENFIIENDSLKVIPYLIKIQKFRTSACNKIIKRSTLVDNKIYFKEGIIAEDIDWGLELTIKAKYYDVVSESFYMYRQREGSVTKTINSKGIMDLWFVLSKWISKISTIDNCEFKDYLMSYIAYHYSILIGLANLNKEIKNDEIFKEIKEYSWVLKYAKNKKTKCIKILYKLTGINISMYILSMFLRIKKIFNI